MSRYAKVIFTTALSCVTVLAGLGVTAPANAVSWGTYHTPGAACVEIGASAGGTINYWAAGQVGNSNSTEAEDLQVTCPIVKPEDVSGSADSMYVSVYGEDNNTGEDISCVAHACTSDRSACATSSGDSSSGFPINVAVALSISTKDIVSVDCVIPDKDTTESQIYAIETTFN